MTELTVTRFRHFGGGTILALSLLAGCSAHWQFDPFQKAEQDAATAGQTADAERSRPHAMLAAARASRINMFGDLESGEGNQYFTRAAVSLKRHTFDEVGQDTDPDLDGTGHRLVFSSTRHNSNPDLYIKTTDGVAVTQLTSDPASDIQPKYSPDDTMVAFASNRAGNWDIWMISADGGQPVQVTSSLADEVHPSWSPDGSRLTYCSLPPEGGQWELWISDATAGGVQKFIGYGLFPEWSPYDDTIVYQRSRERSTRWFSVWTIKLVDGEPRYPTELAAGAFQAMILPTWSADGRYIAFASTDAPPTPGVTIDATDAQFDIWIMTADGRAKTRLTDGHVPSYAPTFSVDGRIYFASNRTGQDNIWSVLPPGAAVTASLAPIPMDINGEENPTPITSSLEDGTQTASRRDGP